MADKLTYRILPVEEWDAVVPLLSYAYPGQEIVLDQDKQSLIVAEQDGKPVAAAVVSEVLMVSYVMPVKTEADPEVFQALLQGVLPEGTVYYSAVLEGPEADALEALGAERLTGAALLLTKT